MQARDVIDSLGLSSHPEGGWYAETWRALAVPGERASGTAIYYLLEFGQRSHWRRVDAAEIWHWYAGGPLELTLSLDGRGNDTALLGPEIAAGQRPQRLVPAGCWQSAVPLAEWTLAGCTVSPGFEFAGFELAPPGWSPESAR
jgi:predicted cupin superfamily sugar epimerase